MSVPKCTMLLNSGKWVNPLDLKPEDIDINDIAHALSQINRFGGHVRRPINVAQHSIYCSRLCDTPHDKLQALLHDASEAYLGDVIKWLKHQPEMDAFRTAEDKLQIMIFEKYGCQPVMTEQVELADRIMVYYEGMRGFGDNFYIDYPGYHRPTPEELDRIGAWGHWHWFETKHNFLFHFDWYRREINDNISALR